MNRERALREHIDKKAQGIEIGPYHNPLVPRRLGYNTTSLDIFDAAELRRRAAADPNIPDDHISLIEEVDLQGSACDIAELVAAKFGTKKFDYIVSSHNFEHLPDPIRFLQGCQEVLAVGGVLSLAVPDRRYCFDFYRPATELSEWLDAFHERRIRPTAGQVFRGAALRSNLLGAGAWVPGTVALPTPEEDLHSAYATWQTGLTAETEPEYTDAHCSAFTPASLELLLADARFLDLIRLETLAIHGPKGCEFFVHLRNPAPGTPPPERSRHYAARAEIMARAAREVIDRTPLRTRVFKRVGRSVRDRGRTVLARIRDGTRGAGR